MANTTKTKKHFRGGLFDGMRVADREEDDLWITLHSLNGKPWTAPGNVSYRNYPEGVIIHGYRKQKNGEFTYSWSRPNR